PGRSEFVILRTGRSPPAASHPASWRRSCIQFQAGERMPEEDLHLSDLARSQAHSPAIYRWVHVFTIRMSPRTGRLRKCTLMSHSYVSNLMHCTFSTKDRSPFIDSNLESRLWPYLGGIARKNRMTALAIGGTTDHLHALLSLPGMMS